MTQFQLMLPFILKFCYNGIISLQFFHPNLGSIYPENKKIVHSDIFGKRLHENVKKTSIFTL